MLLWLVLTLVSSLSGCDTRQAQPADSLSVLVGETMGTTYRITLGEAIDSRRLEALGTSVDQLLDLFEDRMSTYRPGSDISRVNRAEQGEWTEVDQQLIRIGLFASQLNKDSKGAFDVTVGPLVNLWGFGPAEAGNLPPSPEDISRALQQTGMAGLQFRTSPPAIRKTGVAYIDFSAIAKGYGVDVVGKLLRARGFDSFLVEIGGELLARGAKPDGSLWRIAIEQPSPGERRIALVAQLQEAALATSGDYRNFVEYDGKRYSHTIDPRTGYPVSHKLRAVSVIAENCMQADALATALLVMGPDKGFEFAEARALAALFISGDPGEYTMRHSTQFSEYMEASE